MEIAEDVYFLISDQGRPLTLKKNIVGDYNPATSSASVAISEIEAYGLLLNYKSKDQDGERVLAGDRKAVLRALGLTQEPEMGDHIDDGCKAGKIVDIRRIEQRGAAVAYVCQVRY